MTTQTFTASGTFTVPGVTTLEVQATGEGGKGAGGINGSYSGAGGGAGESAAETVLSVTPGSTLVITIGTGGTGTATTVTGGGVPVTANAGGSASTTTPGAGGTGSTNSVHYNGGAGGAGASGSTHVGGGGGSSGGTAAAGNSGASSGSGGGGGSAPTGGGAGGSGGGGIGAGQAGTAPGGGGGGGGNEFGQNGTAGNGAAGQVIITYTIPPVTTSGSVAMPPMAVAATVGGGSTTMSGSVAMPPMAVSAAESPPTASGGAALAPMGVTGTITSEFPFPATPLGIKVELLLGGVWTDITVFVYERDDIVITRGRPDETQEASPAQVTMTLNNRDGRFSPSNTAGPFAPFITRNTQIRVSLNTWSMPFEVLSDTYGDTYGATYGTSSTESIQYTGYRFWGEVSSWVLGVDDSGKDITASVTAAGPLRRFSQGDATIGSALRRYYTRLTGDYAPYGYWPGEDASGASEIASAIAGVAAMAFTGTPGFSSDSDFGGSDSIPSISSSSWHGQTEAASNPPGAGSLTEVTAGTYNWTCPPGVTVVVIPAGGIIGAGGGGGAYGPTKGGGGGGGGGSSSGTVPVTAGVTYEYVVGAGGQAGTAEGTQGTAGGASYFPGDDSETVTGGGGGGGLGGDTSTGGTGGTGTHTGGAGGTGQATATFSNFESLSSYSGATGGASGGTAGQQSVSWTAPDSTTIADVSAGAGGGGGQGGGAFTDGYGGGGGGGGGKTSGTIDVTAGSSYTFYAGDGGRGGSSGQAGQTGGDSSVTGDSSTSVTAHAGGAGSGAGGGGVGGGSTGSPGGNGARAVTDEGMGGGGGGGGGGGDTGTGGNATDVRDPGAGGGNGSGGGWGAASNGGSGATSGGTGQAGVLQESGGGGGGGGGAITNTSGNAGGGGGGGWIYWSWTETGVPVGGGGGGSAGTSSAGNPGSDVGSASAAVPGGGAGGSQGTAGSAPGGGGGGGAPDTGSGVTPPGNGAAGQVSFSWSGGTVSPVAADILRCLLDVDAGGGTADSFSFTATDASPCVFTASGSAYANGTAVTLSGGSMPAGFTAGPTYYVAGASGDTFSLASTSGGSAINSTSTGSGSVVSVQGWVLARAVTYGTVERLDLVYHTGGFLELIGYSGGGSVLFDSGQKAFTADGTPMMVSFGLTANGTGATWQLTAIEPGASSAIADYTGSVSSVTVGYVSDWYVAPNGDVGFASAGHMTAQTYAPDLTVMAPIISGYNGELAADRLARLCGEEGLTFTLVGTDTDTPQMGPQQDDTLIDVFQSCEDLDRGQLFEPRDSFGVSYRTRVSLQGQSPVLTLDWSSEQLAGQILPTADDQYTRNDLTLTRNNGSSAIAVQATGPGSILPPPDGVGDYTYELTVYAYADSQLGPLGAWMLIVGTVTDERYPVLPVNLARVEVVALFGEIADIDIGDYLQVTTPPQWLTSMPIAQLAWGVTERLNTFKWLIDFNAVPEAPYSTGNPPTW